MVLRTAALLLAVCLAAAGAPARRSAPKAASGVQQWLRSLSLRDQVAQLVVVSCYGDLPSARSAYYRNVASTVRDLKVGGLIVVNRVQGGQVQLAQPFEMAAFLNRMQRLARVPLLVGADLERGASMRVANTTKYPHLMAFGAANEVVLTRFLGAATAREARALGVHWVFAPVADVNNNPDNPIINLRSFGEDPQRVAEHVRAFIEGARPQVLLTAKHFPGHGDTATDSHIGLGTVTGDRARLERVELVPFRAAIAAGVDAVMTAHLTVPAIEPEPIPATVSRRVLTDLLRRELGFTGLVVTDAMDMQALSGQFPPGEAAVRALEAGADVLLMPPKPEEAVRAVVAAVRSGRLSAQRIEASVRKVLGAKARLGLDRERLVDLEAISDNLDIPGAAERAQEVANRAITLVKDDGDLVPLRRPESACLFLLAEGRLSPQGRRFSEELRRLGVTMPTTLLDPSVPETTFADAAAKASQCTVNVVAAYATGSAGRGTTALSPPFQRFVTAVQGSGKPLVLVAMGSPYLLRSFPAANAYLAAFSTATTGEIAAARALTGTIPINGRLPVSIPGHAELGRGLTRPALTATQTQE